MEEVKVENSTSKISIYFTSQMETASVTNKANLSYLNGENEYFALPLSAVVLQSQDKKSISIEFPVGYTVKTSDWLGEYDIKGVRVTNVKDINGNIITSGYMDVIAASEAKSKPQYVVDTFVLKEANSTVSAEFQLNQAVSKLSISDFEVNGIRANSGYIAGKKIVINFTDLDDIAAIKESGKDAVLSTAAEVSSANADGITIDSISGEKVYDEQLLPVWKSGEIVRVFSNATTQVVLTFSEPIDQTKLSDAAGDFTVIADETVLNLDYAVPNGGGANQVVFVINDDAAAQSVFSANPLVPITIKAKSLENYHIYDVQDRSGNQNTWKASSHDKSIGIDGTMKIDGGPVNTRN